MLTEKTKGNNKLYRLYHGKDETNYKPQKGRGRLGDVNLKYFSITLIYALSISIF